MDYDIEKMTSRIIPTKMKEFIESNREFFLESKEGIEKYTVLTNNEMSVAYKEQDDEFGYDILPFAVIYDDDYLCLSFENQKTSIIYWSSEKVEKNLAAFKMYDSYEDFLKHIKK